MDHELVGTGEVASWLRESLNPGDELPMFVLARANYDLLDPARRRHYVKAFHFRLRAKCARLQNPVIGNDGHRMARWCESSHRFCEALSALGL